MHEGVHGHGGCMGQTLVVEVISISMALPSFPLPPCTPPAPHADKPADAGAMVLRQLPGTALPPVVDVLEPVWKVRSGFG